MSYNITVNESCKTLRGLGRNALKGRWGLGVLGSLIYFVILLIPAIILSVFFNSGELGQSWVSSLYSFLITGPMMLGYIMFAISIFRKNETSPAEVLYGFEQFGKSLGLYIVMSIFIFLWCLLLIIPGIIATYRYSLCFYVLADHPEMGIMDALNESKRMMKGNKWKMFCLNLSFIGWGLLGCLTFGIGFLWLLPYMQVSVVAFYDIANGSLRAADHNGMMIDGISEPGSNEDMITIDKEAPVTDEPDGAIATDAENTEDNKIEEPKEESKEEPKNE